MRDHKKQRNYSGGVDTEVRFTAEAQRAQRREELADGPSALAFQFECARSQGWDQEAHLRVLCVSAVRRMALVAHYLSSYDSYWKAIKEVANWVKGQGFQDNVVIDVCNECALATLKDPADNSLANTQLSVFTYNGVPYPENNPPTDWAVPLRDMINLVRGQNIQGFFSVVAAYDTDRRGQDQEAVGRARQYYEHVYNGGLSGAPLAPHFGRKPCDKWDDWTDERIADLYLGTALRKYPLYLQEENRRGWKGACCGAGSYEPSDPFKKDPCAGNCTSETDISEQDFYQAASLARNNPTPAWCWVFHTDAGFACGGKSFFGGSRLDWAELTVICDLKNRVVLDKWPSNCSPTTPRCRLEP